MSQYELTRTFSSTYETLKKVLEVRFCELCSPILWHRFHPQYYQDPTHSRPIPTISPLFPRVKRISRVNYLIPTGNSQSKSISQNTLLIPCGFSFDSHYSRESTLRLHIRLKLYKCFFHLNFPTKELFIRTTHRS